MSIVAAMMYSIIIKGISAIVEIVTQVLITHIAGVSGFGDYTFYVSLIEGAYFVLFSGSVKLNTFYLSAPSASMSEFKRKYRLFFVLPIVALIAVLFTLMGNWYGVLSSGILLVYYFSFDRSSVFFSRGRQIPALLGEYLVGRMVTLIGLFTMIKLNMTNGIMLLALYGIQYITMFCWLTAFKKRLSSGTAEVTVPIKKLLEFQVSDIASSLISYSPTILQYIIGGAFSAGFTGIVSIVKKFINFISGPTAKVFLPEFSRLFKLGDKKMLRQSYLMITRIQMVFIGTIGALLIGFPNLILGFFSPELEPYAGVFTFTAASHLLMAGTGPATGLLQMTGNEHVCNRDQWISIGIMAIVWIIFLKQPLFAVYGLCAQAIADGALKYYSACKCLGGNILSIKNYLLLWVPVLVGRLLVEWQGWQQSYIAALIMIFGVFLWNLFFALRDPMVRAEMRNLLKKNRGQA